MKLESNQRVDYETAKQRATKFFRRYPGLHAPSTVATAIWPDARFKGQGAGGAASRILRRMADEGLVKWRCRSTLSGIQDWGWELVAS